MTQYASAAHVNFFPANDNKSLRAALLASHRFSLVEQEEATLPMGSSLPQRPPLPESPQADTLCLQRDEWEIEVEWYSESAYSTRNYHPSLHPESPLESPLIELPRHRALFAWLLCVL